MRTLRRLTLGGFVLVVIVGLLVASGAFVGYTDIVPAMAFALLSMSSTGYAFAVGILGLAMAFRSRQWGWLVAILLPLAVLNYVPRAFFLDQFLISFAEFGEMNLLTVALELTGAALPALVLLSTLLYSRPRGRDLQVPGLEYSHL